ncbi:complement C1q tumor necrosis factor-related protein 3 isoform X5 [Trachypithecus francoisi]|uniref:complement C1q tumor necrosis factor-related protein 3 isoform X5 n=1 Tax=Trachypithecus francoisi TaxID=54180 RepID=UPI00141AED5D|nr:complement C1q tumor necrosis factor-related protein 3 isoform X5 [Trachypithecus francoisi]
MNTWSLHKPEDYPQTAVSVVMETTAFEATKAPLGHRALLAFQETMETMATMEPPAMKEPKIAFMASLATHFSNQNSGIIFSSVETNIGNFFDVMTGRFGAPVSGVYFFTFSMMKHEDVEEVYVYLMHNGNTVFSMYSYETKGKSDTSSNHAVLKLAKGDEVWLRMGNGALHGDHQRFSTFAGFLLFETK